MAKTNEELNEIKEELISFFAKLQELDDEEIETVVGGNIADLICKQDIIFDLIPAPGSKADITKRIINIVLRNVFSDSPTTNTFTGENFDNSKS